MMTNALLIAICVSLVSGVAAYFGFRRASKMKTRAVKAEAKVVAYKERQTERALAEQRLRQELTDSQEFRKTLKEVKNDETAAVAIDDFFTRVERL